jgi:hypothetical protein
MGAVERPLGCHADRFPDDSLFVAMHAFARAGMRKSDVVRLIDESLAGSDCDRRARHLCLHALQFADYLPDQAERMLMLATDMEQRGEKRSQRVLPRCICASATGGMG